jgi:hypothetical protein
MEQEMKNKIFMFDIEDGVEYAWSARAIYDNKQYVDFFT